MEDQSTENIAEVVATKIWYGIAMAAAFIIFGIPYLYFYSQLPNSLTVWLDPKLFILILLAIAVVVVKLVSLTLSFLKRHHKSQSST